MNRTVSAIATSLAVVFGGLILPACNNTGEERWSTRDDSMFGQPSLSVMDGLEEPLPVDHDDAVDARKASIRLLTQAAGSTNPLLRANAIEALHPVPDLLEPIVQRSLADENRGVRFIAAMTVGQLRLTSLTPVVYPLLHDPSPSVQSAAIFALRANGEDVDPTPLSELIMSRDPEVKGNAAMVLGEMGDRSAIPMLRNAVGRHLEQVNPERAQLIDLQLAEAMVRLGHREELQVIRAALFAPAERGELIALACMMLGRLKDVSSTSKLLDLATREGRRRLPAEIRMTATLALAQIDPVQAPIEVPMQYAGSDQFQHRAQAAYTIGMIPGQASMNVLRQLLHDDNPLVQVAAAGAILRQTP